jgi:dual specificity MAP kinase phosphatase
MDFSQITPDLFIGTMPTTADYDRLRALGVRLVLNMRFWTRLRPDTHTPPLDFLWLRTFDTPVILIPIHKLIQGTHAALETIHAGGKVYSHCAAGRHRSVAMGAAILIAQGHTPESAIRLIKRQRPVSDPNMYYIRSRIFHFARQWQAQNLENQTFDRLAL